MNSTDTLDLNKPTEVTLERVAKLIGSKDDSRPRQLRVNTRGIAYLSDVVGTRELDGVALRFETWEAGNSYSGEAAAADESHVGRIHEALLKNWQEFKELGVSLYIDVY